jgi:hypothetical protein
VQRASERVQAFFDQQYGESFVFAGPQGAQAVKRDDLVKALPKRQSFFKSAGLRSSSVVGLEEASVDDRCVLVKAQWRLQFGSATAPVSALDVFSTYLLQQQPDGLRIVFQLDHDDLTKRVQELGLV